MREQMMIAVLAALLHDIGKFRQRAFWGKERLAHDQQGADWVRSRLVSKLNFLSEEDKHRLVQAVREHHERPYDRDARVAVLADRLASGERLERQDEEPGDPSREPLISVFTSVYLPKRSHLTERWAYSTRSLTLDRTSDWRTVFPVRVDQAQVDYVTLWACFEGDIEAMPSSVLGDAETTLISLLALLRKHAWCVPSAIYRSEPDVSLADHLKVTAAIAACIAEFDNAKLSRFEEATEQRRFPDEATCLLVGGDVSGIQSFLYAITSAGAAKSLRGRSAYLSLLSEAVARFVIRELDIPQTNLLYNSGGHFYLLAPLSAQGSVPGLAQRITETLLNIHAGELTVVLEMIELLGEDFNVQTGRLPARWRELSQKLSEQKSRRLREFAESRFETVFGPFAGGGQRDRCAVCHEEVTSFGGIERSVQVWEEGEPAKCSLCQSFENLGTDVAKRNRFLVLIPRTSPPERLLKWHTALAAFGMELWLCDKGQLSEKARKHALVTRLNHPDLSAQDGIAVHDFRWLPTFTPLEEDHTISELGQMADGSEGASYWACLRMDVDNLGQTFQQGLGASYSLSRVSTLSSMLSLFFEGYLNKLCEDIDPQRRHLYLLYAGGDDLLLIGSWDKVLEAAQRIHEEFSAFTCRNNSLTLSGGISLHHPKFPLYQAAADTKEHLDTAKHFKHLDGHEKDAFGFFGQTVSWEDLDWLGRWQGTLFSLIEQGKSDGGMEVKLSRSFLFKLATIANLATQQEREEKAAQYSHADLSRLVSLYKAKWRLVYHLAREHTVFRAELEQLRGELLENSARHLEHLNALVRWVELATRKERG